MPALERILCMGILGSGKSWQWLKMAETLLPTGVIFRCLDTDNAIPFMLDTQFPHLKPENKGNVYVHPAFDWPEYKAGLYWLTKRELKPDQLKLLDDNLLKAYKLPFGNNDWAVVDMADNAWSTVQRYFTTEVFEEDMGDYFLAVRKAVHAKGDRDARNKPVTSIYPEALRGWTDWLVINKLYDDWILPMVYRLPCHIYMTTKVDPIDRGEKDAEILTLFGDLGVRPSGQKKLGNQMHTVLLFIPGKEKWFVTTAKDRAGRDYFKRVPLVNLYRQYLVVKANWPLL